MVLRLQAPMEGDWFLMAPLWVMTLNVNGPLCKVKKGSRKQTWLCQVATYAGAASLGVVGPQEPHLSNLADE